MSNAQIRHDLKNPLAVIKGYTQILNSKLQDQPELSKYSEKIDVLCNQLIQKINELLPDTPPPTES